ncbi:MAG: PblA [Clostridia bacterium]|nr:PblA [Clostridia bacterium]
MAKNQIATAYVQVVPSMEGVATKVRSAFSEAGNSSGNIFGTNLVSRVKTMVATAGIGKAIGDAISSGADLQQSLGGIETLFKDSASIVTQYADQAFSSAGLSANRYMETVTSFSASLISSLGGDTAAAAEAANSALVDMADNANKMGTQMQDIQNAYQGFAKQNYTMLDNLKLGYGGTKAEMERLLADAERLSGIKYDISNLSDVYSAIHVIQEELGIAGATADEAATTITGSFNAMQAAASNLIANLALGRDISQSLQDLADTTKVFLVDNFIPAVGNIFAALPELIGTSFSTAADLIGAELSAKVPELAFIFENLETVVISLTAAMVAYKAATAISSVIDALRAATEGQTIAQTLLNAVMNANPFVLIATLLAGVTAAVITLWNTNEGFRSAVTSAWENVKSTVSAVVDALVGFFTGTVPNAINTLVTGVTSIPGKISSIFQNFSWGSIGSNIISGIARGISSGASAIVSAAQSAARAALNAAKRFLGIASPSKVMRDQVGKFIPEGMAIGIEANTKPLQDAMHDLSDLTTSTIQGDLSRGTATTGVPVSNTGNVYGNSTFTINVFASDNMDVDELAETVMQKIQFAVSQREVCFA